MDITFDITKESFDQLFPQEKQVVVNVLQELHAKYSFFGLQMQVDVPYFFWNMHQTTIFQGVECPELFEEVTAHGFVLKAVYYISEYIVKHRK